MNDFFVQYYIIAERIDQLKEKLKLLRTYESHWRAGYSQASIQWEGQSSLHTQAWARGEAAEYPDYAHVQEYLNLCRQTGCYRPGCIASGMQEVKLQCF